MGEYLRPDVFVEELPSQVQPIEGVGTTTTGFVGVAEWGPLDEATLITGWNQFVDKFGTFASDSVYGQYELPYAVRGFFENGGKRCYIVRVVHRDVSDVLTSAAASALFADQQVTPDADSLTVSAKYHGERGNNYKVTLAANPRVNTTLDADTTYDAGNDETTVPVTSTYGFRLGGEVKISQSGTDDYAQVKAISTTLGTVTVDGALSQTFNAAATIVSEEFDIRVYENNLIVEVWSQVTMVSSYLGVNDPDFVEARVNDLTVGSRYISVTDGSDPTAIFLRQPAAATLTALTGADNGLEVTGSVSLVDADFVGDSAIPSGLQVLLPIDELSIIAIPGETGAIITDAAITFSETGKKTFYITSVPAASATATGAQTYRLNTGSLASSYAGLYFPRIKVRDEIGVGQNATRFLSPDGHLAGIYARTDVERGVFKSPAGVTARIRGALGLEVLVTDGEQEILHPLSVNCLRSRRGRGFVVWGSRTLSPLAEYRYINVRRTLIFLEKSIQDDIDWAVEEPNTEKLWDKLRVNISAFLYERWREGYFQGSDPSEAYFVSVDENNNPQTTVNEGKVIVDIGVAIVKPAEFVILRFINWDGGRVTEELGLSS